MSLSGSALEEIVGLIVAWSGTQAATLPGLSPVIGSADTSARAPEAPAAAPPYPVAAAVPGTAAVTGAAGAGAGAGSGTPTPDMILAIARSASA